VIRLAGFADEIAPHLEEQIATLARERIRFVDLRSVEGTNLLDLTDQQIALIKRTLDDHRIGVAAIASPIGKVPIDSSFDDHLHRFERAITLAHVFQTPYIRMFSFYPPAASGASGGGAAPDPSSYRDEVLRRIREMTARARAANVILLHENEKDIYGDTIARCRDVHENCADAHLRAVLDPANFIQCAQVPYPDAYEALHPWLSYIHVKDARADGQVVAAGEGVARWPELLRRLRADGYDGFLSLEPHLAAGGQFQGFSGAELFGRASQALQQLLQNMQWDYA
jgi:sugar phosphate isomerase/epimerase